MQSRDLRDRAVALADIGCVWLSVVVWCAGGRMQTEPATVSGLRFISRHSLLQ